MSKELSVGIKDLAKRMVQIQDQRTQQCEARKNKAKGVYESLLRELENEEEHLTRMRDNLNKAVETDDYVEMLNS